MFRIDDEKLILRHAGKDYTGCEIKQLVLSRAAYLEQLVCPNLLLFCDDNFEFIINFLAGVFAQKEIFLLTDKQKANLLQGEFIEDIGCVETFKKDFDINYENTYINFFTSGTTNKPKNIRKSLKNLIDEAIDLHKQFPLDKDTVFVTTTKLSHMFGMTFSFMFPFINGFLIDADTIKFPEQIKAKDFAFISTPSFLDKMAKYNINPNPPKYIFAAGDILKNSTFEFFEKNSKVIEIYGSTETGAVGYRTSPKDEYLTSLDEVHISTDENYQIRVKSKYFLKDEITLNDIIEKRGNTFKILKRCDRVLKIQEKRISTVELEDYLNKNPYINTSYCFKHGEKIAAVVVLTKEGREYAIEKGLVCMIKLLKSHMKQYGELYPQKWRFFSEIPKTETGKVDIEKIERIFSLNLSMPLVLNKKVSKRNAEITLAFLKTSNFFNGHFPQTPILPGVVQIFFAHFLAEEVFGIRLNQNKIKKIKFSKIIKPDTPVILKLSDNDLSVDYCYLNDKKIFSSATFIK